MYVLVEEYEIVAIEIVAYQHLDLNFICDNWPVSET